MFTCKETESTKGPHTGANLAEQKWTRDAKAFIHT